MSTSLPPRAQAALDSGNKIMAIKIVRESTGMGLAEAKFLVDRAERRPPGTPPSANSQIADLLIPALEAFRNGHPIEAIKIIRQSGLGLKEAKELLERAQREGSLDAAVRRPIGTPVQHASPGSAPGNLPIKAMLALREGNMVDAIREYRAQHGVGLHDGKLAIEAHLADDPLLKRQYDEARAQRGNPAVKIVVATTLILVAFIVWRIFLSAS